MVTGCFVFLSPLVSLLLRLPLLDEVRWVRSIQVMVFALAILAGVGMEVLVRSRGNQAVRNWLGGGFGFVALVLAGLWVSGRGGLLPAEVTARQKSFIFPAVEVAVGLIVFGFLALMARRKRSNGSGKGWLANPSRLAGGALLVCSTGFLVALGAPWWSSNTTYLKPNSAEVALQRAVGSSLVGFGSSSCWFPPTDGIQANVNVAYGVHELDSYDPLTPQALFNSWDTLTGHYPRPVGVFYYRVPVSMFCPVVATVKEARLFGVSYVLELKGKRGPKGGSVFVEKVGKESLYRIPGASVATLTPLKADGSLPSVHTMGTPVTVKYPTPISWKLVTHADTAQVLRLRLTDVPGWHASIDGSPLPLTDFGGVDAPGADPAGHPQDRAALLA